MPGGLQRLQRGTYSDRGDRNGWTYWDAITLNHVASYFRMFQLAWSGTKTRDLTNMKTAGQIPANQNFQVRSISVQYIAAAARTTLVPIHKLLAETVCEIIINGKDASYQKTLAQMLGLSFLVENATGAANIVTQPFVDTIKQADKLSVPITLAANVPFEVDLTCTVPNAAALDGDIIKIGLNGMLLRAM
jgi:hypothetical protein